METFEQEWKPLVDDATSEAEFVQAAYTRLGDGDSLAGRREALRVPGFTQALEKAMSSFDTSHWIEISVELHSAGHDLAGHVLEGDAFHVVLNGEDRILTFDDFENGREGALVDLPGWGEHGDRVWARLDELAEKMKTMRYAILKPGDSVLEIQHRSEPFTLAEMQELIGGYARDVHGNWSALCHELKCDQVIVLADEDGLLKRDLAFNECALAVLGVELLGNVVVCDARLFE